jgi:UDP-galactose transporter B1
MPDHGAFTLVVCIAGIYSCFLTWAILQERLSTTFYDTTDGVSIKFTSFVFLNACQSLTSALWAFAFITYKRQGVGPYSLDVLKTYLSVAFSASVASPFGYESLAHINYPTHMLAKSCKLVPVMFVGVLLHRRTYPLRKYISVFLVTVGVSAFMLLLPAKGSQASNSLYGLALVTINMLLDGFTGSTQDSLLSGNRGITAYQLMFWMNLFSFGLMLAWIMNPWNSELMEALRFVVHAPRALPDILLFCICGALGQTFVFKSLGSFGSITLVTITVTRKLFTIVLSVIFYGHNIASLQWMTIGIAFMGILIDSFSPKAKKA